jgi:hypothetical protein
VFQAIHEGQRSGMASRSSGEKLSTSTMPATSVGYWWAKRRATSPPYEWAASTKGPVWPDASNSAWQVGDRARRR